MNAEDYEVLDQRASESGREREKREHDRQDERFSNCERKRVD